MIEIIEKKDCCGCNACVTVCAKRCITMQSDEQGFLYPIVDKEMCVDCGLCEKVCPVLNQNEPLKPLKVYAAKNRNEEIRMQSSSGGIFTVLSEAVINEGGIVFGAKFDADWNVVHDWTDTIEGLADFRGSKYVQSVIGSSYKEAKDFLLQGRKVLFSGTPCQIAGLKKYLRKEYDNLLTVDVVCHGVPSPLVWRTYLDEVSQIIRTKCGAGKNMVSLSLNELPVITGISFRDKTNGWKKFGFRIRCAASKAAENLVSESADDVLLYETLDKNLFMQIFLKNLNLRPSCYACPSKSGKCNSDITLADYWGIGVHHPEWDDDKGTSLILVNSKKGGSSLDNLNIEKTETSYIQGLRGNPSIEHSVEYNKYIEHFWIAYHKNGLSDIHDVLSKVKPIFRARIVLKIKETIKFFLPNSIIKLIRKE